MWQLAKLMQDVKEFVGTPVKARQQVWNFDFFCFLVLKINLVLDVFLFLYLSLF